MSDIILRRLTPVNSDGSLLSVCGKLTCEVLDNNTVRVTNFSKLDEPINFILPDDFIKPINSYVVPIPDFKSLGCPSLSSGTGLPVVQFKMPIFYYKGKIYVINDIAPDDTIPVSTYNKSGTREAINYVDALPFEYVSINGTISGINKTIDFMNVKGNLGVVLIGQYVNAGGFACIRSTYFAIDPEFVIDNIFPFNVNTGFSSSSNTSISQVSANGSSFFNETASSDSFSPRYPLIFLNRDTSATLQDDEITFLPDPLPAIFQPIFANRTPEQNTLLQGVYSPADNLTINDCTSNTCIVNEGVIRVNKRTFGLTVLRYNRTNGENGQIFIDPEYIINNRRVTFSDTVNGYFTFAFDSIGIVIPDINGNFYYLSTGGANSSKPTRATLYPCANYSRLI